MVSEKNLYWLAVGVMAIVFTNSAATRQGWLGNLESRSIHYANQISARTLATLNLTQLRVLPQESPRTQTAALRAQAKLGCMQAAFARQEAAFARVEGQRARMDAMHHMHVDLLPQQQSLHIEIPELRFIHTDGTI